MGDEAGFTQARAAYRNQSAQPATPDLDLDMDLDMDMDMDRYITYQHGHLDCSFSPPPSSHAVQE